MKTAAQNTLASVLVASNWTACFATRNKQARLFLMALTLVAFAWGLLPLTLLGGGTAGTSKGSPRFSHPREITNPYLPLRILKQDVLEGKEGAKKMRVERTPKPSVRKVF